jgi:hypothetical protein
LSRIKTAIRFIFSSYLLIKDDPLFIKYLVRFGLGGPILLLAWFIPLALIVGLIGLTSLGLILIGLIAFLALFSLFIWGRIMAMQVIFVFDGYTHPDNNSDEENTEQSWNGLHTREAALLAFSLPGLYFGKVLKGLFKSSKQEESQWIEAVYLLWPLIAIESLSLDPAVNRLKQIKRENLIRFHPSFIPVSQATGIIQWGLILLGAWIGFVVGMNTADPLSTTGIVPILGALIGLLLAGVFALIGIHLNTFSQACYYAALYRWVNNVETAISTGMPEKAAPPAILSRTLGNAIKSKKER